MAQRSSKRQGSNQDGKAPVDGADDFVRAQGVGFLAHILDRLQDRLAQGFGQWYREIGIEAPARTHSTMRALDVSGPLAVTDLAALIKQSHPLVINWIRALQTLGFVETSTDPTDRRRTIVSLTPNGRADLERQKRAEPIFTAAIEELLGEARADIFDPLWRIEVQLSQKSFLDRLRAATKTNPTDFPDN